MFGDTRLDSIRNEYIRSLEVMNKEVKMSVNRFKWFGDMSKDQ